jgi:D-alanyl-lipoteichoic acid acyltransferase DltB (MBOAT superfamily)
MIFNSLEFLLILLPTSLIVFYFLARVSRIAQIYWLGLVSIIFFGFWDPKSIPLLLTSICTNFIFGQIILRAQDQKLKERAAAFATMAVVINVLLLCYYKYGNFLLESY